MSDVSGIPYMGPMGMGNMFASPYPALTGGGNMSAGQISQPYMPEVNYNQNVVNNLWASGGGFGQLTNYYSQLGANQLSGLTPNTFNMTNAGTGQTMAQLYGGGGASPYQTSPNVFDTGASGFSYPGAGMVDWSMFNQPASPYQTSPNVFSQGASPFNYSGAGLDWSGMYQPQQSSFGAGSSLFGSDGAYQGSNNSMNWSSLFGGGDSGPRSDPYPGMSMPGGLNSPMTTNRSSGLDWSNFQSPANDYSTFQAGKSGGDPYPGMAMPGGLGSPMTTSDRPDFNTLFADRAGSLGSSGMEDFQSPANDYGTFQQAGTPTPEAGTRTYDLAPMFEGGGGGFGTGGADTSQLFGAEATGQGGNAFSYNPQATGAQDVFGQPADAMAEQARARLASLMGSGDDRALETAVDPTRTLIPEVPVAPTEPAAAPAEGPFDNLPQPVTPGATTPATELYPGETPPRPPGDIPIASTPEARLAPGADLRGVNPRLVAAVAGGATFLPPGYTVEPVSGVREGKGQSYHSGGRAADFRIIGPDGPISNRGEDSTGMYTLLARGVKTWVQQNDPALAGQMGYGGAFGTQLGGGGVPDLMHYDLGGSRGRMVPDVQFGNLQPLSAEERNAMPANIPLLGANQVALDAPGAGPYAPQSVPLPMERPAEAPVRESPVNVGQDIPRPPMDIPDPRVSGGGFNALDAAANVPKGPSGVEKSQTFLNRSLGSILQQHSPENVGKAGMFLDLNQPMREALKGPFGSQILSGLQPKLGSLGLTREDFAKAIADPRARFAGGVEGAAQPAAAGAGTASSYWNVPQQGTPGWNAEVYEPAFGGFVMRRPGEETTGGASHYTDFPRTGNVEDRRGEFLTPEQRASLPPAQYYPGPEPAATPLSSALGLGDLPVPRGGAAAAAVRPQGIAGDGAEGNIFNDRWPGTDMRDFQSPANDYSMFQQAASPGAEPFNPLVAQRSPYADTIRDDPNKALQLAARLYSEDQNNPATRTAIMEAMLNANTATGRDPINPRPSYYPSNPAAYRDALAKLSSNPALLAQVRQDMERAFGGSNVSNHATDWASAGTAADERKYTTNTWTSPTNEQFFRKDLNTVNPRTGEPWAGYSDPDRNRKWYESVTSPFPR